MNILNSSYRPDTIVAISRGGFVPARFVCDFLRVSNMLSIRVQPYEPGARRMTQVSVKHPLPGGMNLRRSKVLIVDDVNDTGDSLQAVVEHLTHFQPADLKTAVLHQKETTKWDADYFEAAVKEWLWIIYPWAAVEDVGSFIAAMQPVPSGVQEIANRLKQDYGILINQGWLQKIITMNRLQNASSSDEPQS